MEVFSQRTFRALIAWSAYRCFHGTYSLRIAAAISFLNIQPIFFGKSWCIWAAQNLSRSCLFFFSLGVYTVLLGYIQRDAAAFSFVMMG